MVTVLALPMKASRSPSPSISANSGLARRPTAVIPKGLLLDAAKLERQMSLCFGNKRCCRSKRQ